MDFIVHMFLTVSLFISSLVGGGQVVTPVVTPTYQVVTQEPSASSTVPSKPSVRVITHVTTVTPTKTTVEAPVESVVNVPQNNTPIELPPFIIRTPQIIMEEPIASSPASVVVPEPTCTLTAESNVADMGSMVLLKWTSTGATKAIITNPRQAYSGSKYGTYVNNGSISLYEMNGEGKFQISGEGDELNTFTIVFSGEGGQVSCETKVTTK